MAARNFCSACGLPLDIGAAFCGNCGTSVLASVPQSSQPRLDSLKNKASAPQVALPVYGGTLFGNGPVASPEMFSSFVDEEAYEREWYERTWFVVLLLICFWVIGVILLWRSKFFTTGQKIVLSIGTALFDAFLMGILVAMLTPSTGVNSLSSIHPAPISDVQSTALPQSSQPVTPPIETTKTVDATAFSDHTMEFYIRCQGNMVIITAICQTEYKEAIEREYPRVCSVAQYLTTTLYQVAENSLILSGASSISEHEALSNSFLEESKRQLNASNTIQTFHSHMTETQECVESAVPLMKLAPASLGTVKGLWVNEP